MDSVVAGVTLSEAIVCGRQGDVVMGRPITARLVASFGTGGARCLVKSFSAMRRVFSVSSCRDVVTKGDGCSQDWGSRGDWLEEIVRRCRGR